MISSKSPSTWQDLQQQSARVLAECGFDIEIEKVVQLARGQAEIDVYAEESLKGRKYVTLCECKHWKSPVPQSVIHSFRSVMADTGAHKGYIISSAGFQSGAYEAAQLTNVELVTWDQFQVAFEASWLENYFTPTITAKLDPLMSYCEPFLPQWFSDLPEADQQEFIALKDKHDPLGWFAMSLASYSRPFRVGYPRLPLKDNLDPTGKFDGLPCQILSAQGYRDLLDIFLQIGEAVIAKFRAIRDRNLKTGGE